MKIREIMTTDPVSVQPDTTLEEIATVMKQEDIGAVPVVEDGELVGIVTDRDIVVRCVAEGKDSAECTADEVMSEEIHWLAPDASLDQAARMMADRQIRRLPIVEKNRLIGMVSLGDLAVKCHDDDLSGDTLEDVSKGVKQSSGGRAHAGRQGVDLDQGRLENDEPAGRQSGADRSGVKAGKQRQPKQEAQEASKRQPQGLRSQSSAKKQGIANRSSKEENQRNDKVIPFRAENEVRNTRVQKPGKGRKSAS